MSNKKGVSAGPPRSTWLRQVPDYPVVTELWKWLTGPHLNALGNSREQAAARRQVTTSLAEAIAGHRLSPELCVRAAAEKAGSSATRPAERRRAQTTVVRSCSHQCCTFHVRGMHKSIYTSQFLTLLSGGALAEGSSLTTRVRAVRRAVPRRAPSPQISARHAPKRGKMVVNQGILKHQAAVKQTACFETWKNWPTDREEGDWAPPLSAGRTSRRGSVGVLPHPRGHARLGRGKAGVHLVLCTESYNHRKFWVGRDPQRSSSPTPPQRAGTPLIRSGCSEPCPTWSWMFPGMGPPLPLWATRSSVSPPSL